MGFDLNLKYFNFQFYFRKKKEKTDTEDANKKFQKKTIVPENLEVFKDSKKTKS